WVSSAILANNGRGTLSMTNQPWSSTASAKVDRPAPDMPVINRNSTIGGHRTGRRCFRAGWPRCGSFWGAAQGQSDQGGDAADAGLGDHDGPHERIAGVVGVAPQDVAVSDGEHCRDDRLAPGPVADHPQGVEAEFD